MHYNTYRYYKRIDVLKRLLGNICKSCGTSTNLQFHHDNPDEKEFNITSEFSRPWNVLLKELSKCSLRCSNCHKKEHAAQHGIGMYTHYKCRCTVCKTAWSIKIKEYKQAAKSRNILRGKESVL